MSQAVFCSSRISEPQIIALTCEPIGKRIAWSIVKPGSSNIDESVLQKHSLALPVRLEQRLHSRIPDVPDRVDVSILGCDLETLKVKAIVLDLL